jgi:hypothetical protein
LSRSRVEPVSRIEPVNALNCGASWRSSSAGVPVIVSGWLSAGDSVLSPLFDGMKFTRIVFSSIREMVIMTVRLPSSGMSSVNIRSILSVG